jgi:hypothetical protein
LASTVRRSPWVRAGALVLVVSTLLATALAFASSLGSKDATPRLGLSAATTTTLSDRQKMLAARLPDGPLDGLARSAEDLGPLTLETAADQYPFGDPKGARLKAYGFVQGFDRVWVGADGRTASALVYEMRDPSGFMQDWTVAVAGMADGHFATPVGEGITDVQGTAGSADRGEWSVVAWVEGTYWYYIAHFGAVDGTGPDHARTIVAAVRAR